MSKKYTHLQKNGLSAHIETSPSLNNQALYSKLTWGVALASSPISKYSAFSIPANPE